MRLLEYLDMMIILNAIFYKFKYEIVLIKINKKIFSDDLKEEKSINLIIINSLINNDSSYPKS